MGGTSMTLRHMKIFVSVFRHSSMSRAAEELHLAQPSVSLAIKELETYYGVRLFERIGRRISPTELGKEFYGYALHIVSLFEEMEKKIKNWDTIGTVRIGTSITIGTHILPSLIKQYNSLFPGVTVEATVSNSADIESRILDNTIDIGLIETQPYSTELCHIPFMQDELAAIVPPESPLASEPYVTLEMLASEPFLMREKGSAGRDILDRLFAALGINIRPVWKSSSTQAIVKGVSEGLGVAVLPYLLIENDVKTGAVANVPFREPLRRDLNIIYHKNKYLTPSMHEFIILCKKALRP